MTLSCLRSENRQHDNELHKQSNNMKNKRLSAYCRRESRVSPLPSTLPSALPSALPSSALTSTSPLTTTDVMRHVTLSDDVYAHAPSSCHSLSASRDDDVIDDVSRISRLSLRQVAPGAQCSSNDLGLSMGPLHSTMDYPQYSTPDAQHSLSRTDDRKQQILKANGRLPPLGEERKHQIICDPPLRDLVRRGEISRDLAKGSRTRDQKQTTNCFARKSAHVTRKSRVIPSKQRTDLVSYRTVSRVLRRSRDSSSYCSMAANAGSWIDEVKGDLSRCRTESGSASRPGGARHSVTSPGCASRCHDDDDAPSEPRLASAGADRSGYVSVAQNGGRSRWSTDSFFASPAPVGTRPPCIGKEWSPAPTECPPSGSSSGYQSKREDPSTKCDPDHAHLRTCAQCCLDTKSSRTKIRVSNFSLGDWSTLAIF